MNSNITLVLRVSFPILVFVFSTVCSPQLYAEEVTQSPPWVVSEMKVFDKKTSRWIAEMKEESLVLTLRRLTDAAEYHTPMVGIANFNQADFFHDDAARDKSRYSRDIESILSNRRFRKAYEELQKVDKKTAAELLTTNIRENLKVVKALLQEEMEIAAQGKHKGLIGTIVVIPDPYSYRYVSHPNYPPTHTGRKFGILSYIWLASLLELSEVAPAVEEVVAWAKVEYQFYNRVNDKEAGSFKTALLSKSLYNPSLLVTATLCDPAWNIEKRKLLADKLVQCEIVDHQARTTEYDQPGREGWVPVVPFEKMLPIRYYKGITDAEFNDFFEK